MWLPTKSTQSPAAWQRLKLAVAAGAALIGFTSVGTGATLRTAYAKLRELPLTPQDFGAVGDGVTNDNTAWQAWSSACQANQLPGRIPAGTYLIDSWVVNTPGSCFYGDSLGIGGVAIGAKIKCRANITNFVDFSGAYVSTLDNVEIDGNNHATNTFAIHAQTFAFRSSRVTVGGCVDNGINCDLSGTTTNTQVAEMTFVDWQFTGTGNRVGGTGIVNLKINSNQSLVFAFVRPMFGGFGAAGDTALHISIPLGTASFYTPFFTGGNSGYDVRIGNGGSGGGSVTFIDGRSESTARDSIYVDGGSADVTLINFVHGTVTNTSLNATANFTGRISVLGGQYYIVTNGSATAEIVMLNHKDLGGGYQGAYSDRIVTAQDGTITARVLAAKGAAGTLQSWKDTTNAKTAYLNYVNDVLTLYRNGPTENCNWDATGILTNQASIKAKSKIYPGTDAGALQTASGIFAGTGAPNNANGANGDIYIRSDGGALTTIYQRRAGAWAGIV